MKKIDSKISSYLTSNGKLDIILAPNVKRTTGPQGAVKSKKNAQQFDEHFLRPNRDKDDGNGKNSVWGKEILTGPIKKMISRKK